MSAIPGLQRRDHFNMHVDVVIHRIYWQRPWSVKNELNSSTNYPFYVLLLHAAIIKSIKSILLGLLNHYKILNCKFIFKNIFSWLSIHCCVRRYLLHFILVCMLIPFVGKCQCRSYFVLYVLFVVHILILAIYDSKQIDLVSDISFQFRYMLTYLPNIWSFGQKKFY